MANAPTEAGAPADPMQDPEKRERVELARNFAFHLLKGIKQIGMYRHNESRFGEFLQKAHEAIGQYTVRHGALSMKVEPQNLLLYGQTLFSEDNALPYKFYKDGIRQLIFRPDLTVDELVAFTLIAVSDTERGGEDVLAQLWKAGFEHIEYVVVEGFKMEEFSEEEVQVEVDKIVGYLYNRLRTNSDDFLRFARVSTEDLDAKIDDVDQLRGLVIAGQPASDALKARIQKELEEEEGQRLFPKLVSAVFQVVESGVDDASALEEMFVQLLDAMLLQEDFATINSIVLKLRAMEQRDPSNSVIARLRLTFVTKMGEEQRLGRIGEILRTTRPKNPQDLVRYLDAVEDLPTPVLLDVLESVELPENRTLLCDVLARYAKEAPEPFVHRLESDRPQTVRDMVYILEKSGHPDRIKIFGTVLKHKNLAVKLDAMHVIARGQTGEARKLIADCLHDASAQVRMLAARLLPEFDREKAYLDLVKVIKDPSFEKKSPEEKTAFYAALGSTGLPGAFSMLQSILATKPSLLNKARVLNDKLLAVSGLGAAQSIQALKLLQQVVDDKTQPTEVLVAARKAMYQTKKALFGDNAEAN
ncbi:MAG: HEAT repeat domain-containing protein [Myxococcaceae bacterium]|nr:HEAT repeat domain-containing protein [Myxococcaceae bacterium]